MLCFSLEVPCRRASNQYPQRTFYGEIRKYYANTPFYLELCRIRRKMHLGLAKAGLNFGVILLSSGHNSGI